MSSRSRMGAHFKGVASVLVLKGVGHSEELTVEEKSTETRHRHLREAPEIKLNQIIQVYFEVSSTTDKFLLLTRVASITRKEALR